ncbi:MAG: hypothetical protein KAT29_09960, partial [Anaerolineales bacterium]|nr:hypothetical protein [Anaerolineales bacterium]
TYSHTAAPIPVNAQGPAGDLAIGEYENTHIYDIMFASAGFADYNRVFLPLSLHSYGKFPK